MADIKSPEERSRNMSAIRSKDTEPEVYLRKLLFSEGLRYRKNVRNLPGCPDMYLARYNTAIFVHGCYWHRHEGCKYATTPSSNSEYWQTKFHRNTENDKKHVQELNTLGWKVITIWECEIKKSFDETMSRVIGDLREQSGVQKEC